MSEEQPGALFKISWRVAPSGSEVGPIRVLASPCAAIEARVLPLTRTRCLPGYRCELSDSGMVTATASAAASGAGGDDEDEDADEMSEEELLALVESSMRAQVDPSTARGRLRRGPLESLPLRACVPA